MQPSDGQLLGLGLSELGRGLGSGTSGETFPDLGKLLVQAVGLGPGLAAGLAVVAGSQAEGEFRASVVPDQTRGARRR